MILTDDEIRTLYRQGEEATVAFIRSLLQKIESLKNQPEEKLSLTAKEMAPWLKHYRKILKEGYEENPSPPVRTGKRGRLKKTKAQNLLERLDHYRRNVLAFLYDFRIPFTNN